ncbi:MAG: sialate O-acetylesterase, partial [Bacteroidales bacterium]|nr:sialate O-acetylesterase [Bacteroidales bacterium]
SLKNPCADGMVIQQNTDAVIWGFASPGSTITVQPSWSKLKYRVTTDDSGEWKAKVSTPEGGFTRYEIRVKGDGSDLIISNVLVGEVWFASGQSNMEMPLRGWEFCQIDNQQEHISAPADSDGVRMFIVPKEVSVTPVRNAEGRWWYSTPAERAEMSATAYFFAKTLRETLNVPVGIINSSYGGTMLECWAPKNIAEKWGLPVDEESLNSIKLWDRQTAQYNKMVSPCVGYTIKGMIWYQGCANVGRCDDYAQRFADIIAEYRANWGVGEFPVYLAEIAPYDYGYNQSPFLRAQQWKSAEITPNCEVIPTNDLVHEYERRNIHPGNKLEVGRRLAYLGLNRDYGFSGIKCYAPKVVSARIDKPGEIVLQITNARNGFRMDSDIEGLEVAGSDMQFHPVRTFRLDNVNGLMYIHHDSVPEPKYVRYCWGDWILGNLISCDGFPMQTFCIGVDSM